MGFSGAALLGADIFAGGVGEAALGAGELLGADAAGAGLGLAEGAGAVGAGVDLAASGAGEAASGLSAADLAAGAGAVPSFSGLGGLSDVAGTAGSSGAGLASSTAPALSLPGSTLPTSAGFSASSITPSFAPDVGASGLDPLASWGTGGIQDASSTYPSLAGQSAAVDPGAAPPGWTANTGTTAFPGSGGAAASGAAATPGAASSVSPDVLTQFSSNEFAGVPPQTATDAAALPAASTPTAGTTPIAGAPAAAPATPAGATPASPAAAAASTPSAGGGGIMDWIKANPVMAASLGIGGGLLAKNALMPAAKLPQQDQLDSIAAQAQAMSAQNQALEQRLLDPLATGQLPAAQQAQVDQALQDSITSIKSKYAGMGMSGSTVEQDDINAAQQKALVLSGTLAEQMAQTGLSAGSQAATALQISGTIYEQLMQQQIQQDTALQQAIAAFAGQAAIAGAISTKKAA